MKSLRYVSIRDSWKHNLVLLQKRYQQAKLSTTDRQAKVDMVVQSLERDLELLCVTGVEDQLQVRTLR